MAALAGAWLLGTAVGKQAESAREAERARIQLEVAREIHDVVGHALGVISAEAAVTRYLPDAGDQELRDSLGTVEVHAREALEEVQMPRPDGLAVAREILAGTTTRVIMLTTFDLDEYVHEALCLGVVATPLPFSDYVPRGS